MNTNHTRIENNIAIVEQQYQNKTRSKKELANDCCEIMNDIKSHCCTKNDNSFVPDDAGNKLIKRLCDVYHKL
jgi:hypothetical protein